MSKTGWATITKRQLLDGVTNKHLFLIFLEAGKSKIKVLAESVSGEGSLSAVPLHGGERGALGSSNQGPNLILGLHHHDLI